MEHSIHVAGGHFIKAISPVSSRSITQKSKDRVGEREDDEENDGTEFDAGDTIGKALALVTQARSLSIIGGMVLTVLIDPEVTTGTRLFPPSL
jgi:hypothetical protein